jgi:FkbM family methyltransferase
MMIYQNWKILDGDNSFPMSVKRLRKSGKPGDILLYQKDNLDRALTLVKDWQLAIDGGANYGLMSYHMNSRFDQVLAFEIDDQLRTCLADNMKTFACSKVRIEPYGLGDREKSVDLVKTQKSFGNFVNPATESGKFAVRSIDSYELDTVGFIKLDCEGYEPFIIQGAEHTIKRSWPVILMERKVLVNKFNFGTHATEHLLRTWGYNKVIDLGKDIILAKT